MTHSKFIFAIRTLGILFLLAVVSTSVVAQEKRLLTMEEAVLGSNLRPDNLEVQWRADLSEYTLFRDGMLISVNPKNAEQTNIISYNEIGELIGDEIKSIPYKWADANNIWVFEKGTKYKIDILTKQVVEKYKLPVEENLTRVGEGENYAYTRQNNLYYLPWGEKEVAITAFEDKNIVCGQVVSRNEFGIKKGIFPSPDGNKIAFYQKDESKVTTFSLFDISTRTGSSVEIKYPMIGMDSEIVTLWIYDIASGKTVYANVTDFDNERYLTNVTWSPSSEAIFIQILDRTQKHVKLNVYNPSTGEYINTILTEDDERYVEPQHSLVFLEHDPSNFIYTTNNRDGFFNLYVYSIKERNLERLTNVNADVEYLAQDKRYVYYYSREVSPIERQLFRVDLRDGESTRLTTAEGFHSCKISSDGKYFIDSYSSLTVPRIIEVCSTNGKERMEIFRATDPTADLCFSPIELGSIKSADGKYDNYYRLIKPLDFDPAKKYPTIMYVYGGPHSQMVLNTFQGNLRRWEMYMAQRGYVVFTMDNRGTSGQGAEFEKSVHNQLGVLEMDDQMEGVKWLTSQPWVDAERIGVHGWSYGGFMAISLMVNYPEVFKVGVAGGPVIDWKWYEIMYGERYMETEETNPEGFKQTSLIPRAKDLKGKLLVCQGVLDNVVLWQHSLNFVNECIKSGVQLDYFPYPRSEHNMMGKDRVHLMQKVTDYFDDFL